ncbi:polar amino acid transport system permease protein [Erwinia toletana]|uniref:Polar amino acid transport system permease protein n=1 Tax=Winslowiella toletana TaxID=92490 RepID=A0ABS4PAA6_9GAMM|nr:amino acid ABC transporter permease [Winslowiella toletana]MBP2169575.1 polar amino acid transport system permease protein [Winslowiella toletana]
MVQGWSWEGYFHYLTNHFIFMGAVNTVLLTLAGMAGGLLFGVLLAFARLSPWGWVNQLARIYIWLFRGTPLLVQLIIIYTGLPQIGIRFTVIEAVVIGLVLNEAAYLAEIIRGGVQALSRGQINAAKALGFHHLGVVRYVIFPQTMRLILPSLGNSFNGLLKTTSIASVISMEELLRRTQILMQEQFMVLELFMVAATYYLILTTLWDFIQRKIERHYARAYQSTTSAPTVRKSVLQRITTTFARGTPR